MAASLLYYLNVELLSMKMTKNAGLNATKDALGQKEVKISFWRFYAVYAM